MGKNNVLKIFRFACLLCIIGLGLTAIGCSGGGIDGGGNGETCEPEIVGSVDTPGDAKDVHVSGSHAYVADNMADGSYGLQVIDVSDPANPVIAGSVDTPGAGHGPKGGVHVSGSNAYVADWLDYVYLNGLQVIDICD